MLILRHLSFYCRNKPFQAPFKAFQIDDNAEKRVGFYCNALLVGCRKWGGDILCPPTLCHPQFPPLPPDNKGAWALLSKSLPSALHSLFLLSQHRSPLLKLDFPPPVGMQGNGRQVYCIYHLYPNKDKDKTERKISGTSQQRFPTTTSRLATNWCNNQIGDIRPQTQDWRRKSAKN